MTTVFLTLIFSIILFVVVGLGFLIYSIVNSKNNMNEETKTKAIDVFIYFGIFVTLVVSVTNIIQILFAAIERKFTDVLEIGQYVDIYSSDMRLAIASLVVVFPLYLALSWYVSKDISKFIYKRDLLIRKIFIYVTLFVTASTLLGSLVAVIYTYLGGELTIRFGLKAFAIFVIAGAVCGYYVYSLRRDYSRETKIPLISSIVVSLLVVLSLVWSISIIGSPQEMRLKRIDDTRLSDISRIQQEVFNHFQNTDRLPISLLELNDAFQGYSVPKDPVSEKEYTYKVMQQPIVKLNYQTNKKEVTLPAVFEICATFDTVREYDSRGQPIGKGGMGVSENFYSVTNYYYMGDVSPFWNHGIGNTCFKRIITSDMYYGR